MTDVPFAVIFPIIIKHFSNISNLSCYVAVLTKEDLKGIVRLCVCKMCMYLCYKSMGIFFFTLRDI